MALFDLGRKRGNDAGGMPGAANVPVSQVLNMKAQGMTNAQIANGLRASGYSLTQIRDAMAQAEIKSAVVPGGDAGMMYTGGPMPQQMMGGPMEEQMPEMPEVGPMPDFGPMPEEQGMQGMDMGDMGMPPGMEMPPLPEVSAQPNFQQQQMMQPTPMRSGPVASEQLINELQRIIEEVIQEKWAEVEDKLNSLDVWKTRVDGRVESVAEQIKSLTGRIDDFGKGMMAKGEEYKSAMEEVGTEMSAIEKLMGKLIPSLADEIKELRNVVDKMKKK
jgi:hypothetical protein